jgi:hypothetical protein
MLNVVLIIILFILIILSQFSENMTNNYNKYLNNESSLLLNKEVYKSDEYIEITNLESCNKSITVDYGLNINPINNDSITINQTINEPLIHTIEVDNINYNLVQIEWRKTNFTYNNNKIGLTLHLIHSNFKSSEKLNIIIPLDFIENVDNIESFKNTFYNKMDSFFKTNIPNADNNNILSNTNNITESTNNSKSKFKLSENYKRKYNIKKVNTNSLLNSNIEIPTYQCCKNTSGPTMNTNLCLLKTIIESNNKYLFNKNWESNS